MTPLAEAPRGHKPTRVIIVGAGSAGRLVAREIQRASRLGLDAVGFADDDPAKIGTRVEGVIVLGTTSDLPRITRETAGDLAILALPSAPGHVVRAISSLCRSLHLPLRTVPSLSEILSGTVKASAIRDIDVADLLRRPAAINDPAFGAYLKGASVLVTGAGGSIGSELCRDVLRFDPERLILFDVSENALYEVDRQLRRLGNPATVVPVIGNIRDRSKVDRVLRSHRPSVVFHAAAYKHIPMTESNEDEAVLNIVFGTRNLLEASEACAVDRFVLVSTDKAVEPASVMGASKRVAELLVREAAGRTGRNMVAVRFGNVLASSGSVVPLFREQIALGGPVTVRDPEVERYFMTIQEASGLLVCAGALGVGGEIFVLEMGQPVRILALAEDLIRLSGLEPGRDIEIVFSGLHQGEKMGESLFTETERAARTRHPQILSARTSKHDVVPSKALLDRMEAAALGGNALLVRDLLREIVPTLGAAVPDRDSLTVRQP